VRSQVLTAACMKITVFGNVAPCRLIDVHRRFVALMMGAASTSETSVNCNSTRRYNPGRRPSGFGCHYSKCGTCLCGTHRFFLCVTDIKNRGYVNPDTAFGGRLQYFDCDWFTVRYMQHYKQKSGLQPKASALTLDPIILM
jgi:hypothetical protein